MTAGAPALGWKAKQTDVRCESPAAGVKPNVVSGRGDGMCKGQEDGSGVPSAAGEGRVRVGALGAVGWRGHITVDLTSRANSYREGVVTYGVT